jgi:hypothetical protein
MKCNRNSNGRKKKFIRLEKTGVLLVADKENTIEKYKKNKKSIALIFLISFQ